MKGSLPSDIGSLQELRALRLFSNNLDGPIPASLGSLSKLTDLSVLPALLLPPQDQSLEHCHHIPNRLEQCLVSDEVHHRVLSSVLWAPGGCIPMRLWALFLAPWLR